MLFQQLFNKPSVKSLLTTTHYSSNPEELEQPSKQLSARKMKKDTRQKSHLRYHKKAQK
jgi:hypothetical protein